MIDGYSWAAKAEFVCVLLDRSRSYCWEVKVLQHLTPLGYLAIQAPGNSILLLRRKSSPEMLEELSVMDDEAGRAGWDGFMHLWIRVRLGHS